METAPEADVNKKSSSVACGHNHRKHAQENEKGRQARRSHGTRVRKWSQAAQRLEVTVRVFVFFFLLRGHEREIRKERKANQTKRQAPSSLHRYMSVSTDAGGKEGLEQGCVYRQHTCVTHTNTNTPYTSEEENGKERQRKGGDAEDGEKGGRKAHSSCGRNKTKNKAKGGSHTHTKKNHKSEKERRS